MENKKKNKDLIQGIIIYAIGNFGSKILIFLIVPLYTYYISTSDMGNYDLTMTTISLLTPIVTMQISDAAYRWMVRDIDNIKKYITATFQVLVLNSLVAAICIFCVHFLYPFRYLWYFIFVLITARALQTTQKLLRGLKNQKLFAFSGILYTVLFLTLNILQICYLKQGVEALFQSAIIANIITLIVVYFCEKRLHVSIFGRPDTKTIKELLVFSIPLVPNQLNWWIINSSDRYIIRVFLGAAANGIYSISYKFPTMLQVILNLFNTSWQDVSIADTDLNPGKYYSKVFKKLYMFSFSLLWFLIPFTKIFIIITMNSTYHGAAKYISFLYLGTVFQSFSSFYGVGYLRDKNTKNASRTSIYGAIVNALINIMFVRFVGLHAASISTFVGFLAMWLVREKQNRKSLGVKIDKKIFGSLMAITCILSSAECFLSMKYDILLFVSGTIGFIVVNRSQIAYFVIKIEGKLKRCTKE